MTAVGRQREIETVDRFLAAVPGAGGALVLGGDPGVGKTTVWEVARHRCEALGYRTLAARPTESESSWPYVALGDLLAPLVGGVLSRLPPPQARALDVALLREEPAERFDHGAVSAGLLGALQLLAGEQPVVLCVDDLQWFDGASALAVSYVLRRSAGSPIALVATMRAGSTSPIDLANVGGVACLEVGPLGVGALSHVLQDRLGTPLPRPVVRRIHETTGGNPLYAIEVARALTWSGGVVRPGEPLALPEIHQQLLAHRLAALSPHTRRLLLLVAVESQPTVAELAAIEGKRFEAMLDEATGAGVLVEEAGRVRFTHPLLASAAYSSAEPKARRDAHRVLAEASSRPERRARHLALATTAPDADVAATIEEGAHAMAARGAVLDAAALYERSAGLTPSGEAAEQRRRLVAAALHYRLAGDRSRVEELLIDAERTWPVGRIRALALLMLASVLDGDHQAADALYRRAAEELSDDPEWCAAIEVGRAWVAIVTGAWRAAVDHAQRGVDLVEVYGSPFGRGVILATLVEAAFLAGDGVDHGLIERAVEYEAHEPPPLCAVGEVPPNTARAVPSEACGAVLKWSGDLDAGRGMLVHAREQADVHGDEHSYAVANYHLAELECWAGNWDDAAAYAAEGLHASPAARQPRAAVLYAAALVDAHLGRRDAARRRAEEGLAIAREVRAMTRVAQNTAVLGFVALSDADPAAAHELLGPLTQSARGSGVAEPGVLRFVPDDVEALLALGQPDAAAECLAWFERLAHATGRPWALATAGRCRGLLEAATGDLDAGIATLEAAMQHHVRVPEPFERARSLLALGVLRRRARQKAAARETLEESRAIFERLGAPLWAERTRCELARIGGRTTAPTELTPTETQVADLVANGCSNREVADTLHISVKTVESNLTRIYRKLGVRSRTELAATNSSRLR